MPADPVSLRTVADADLSATDPSVPDRSILDRSVPGPSIPDASPVAPADSGPAGSGAPGGGAGARPAGDPAQQQPARQRRRRTRRGQFFAALDLGTNNCRLLVAQPDREGFTVVDAFSRIVRLGEGLRESGQLSDDAMDRAVRALHICAGKLRRRQVTRVRAIATEACRRASNGAAFLDRVQKETGLRLDIISTAEEAKLALAGCAPLLDFSHNRALVFDIGGGSTELSWVALDHRCGPSDPERIRSLGWFSLPWGVVNLSEHWSEAGDPADQPMTAYGRMVDHIGDQLTAQKARFDWSDELAADAVQLLGTSGTVTTVAGVMLDLPRYDRSAVDGRWLDVVEVERISHGLARMAVAERAGHPCIGPERADLVVAGCAILEAIHRLWPTRRLRVADRGVREGLLHGLMKHHRGGRRRPHRHRSGRPHGGGSEGGGGRQEPTPAAG
ncbi:MAG: Ppx/GppA phosphatase family protein [Sneathiellaceae bacterium]